MSTFTAPDTLRSALSQLQFLVLHDFLIAKPCELSSGELEPLLDTSNRFLQL